MFRQGFKDCNFTPESSLLTAYGIYLMGGGCPDDFGRMTEEDVQIMLTTFHGTQEMLAHRIVAELAKWMGGTQ